MPTTTPQTFVWNWFWNCASDEGVPSVPAPPAGATTIVLNWHWACADAPPPLDIAGVTVCTSCNIAISVRISSPGDTGDVTQSIAATTAAAASNVANTIQAALQAAIPPPAPQAGNAIPDAAAAAVAAASAVSVPAPTYRLDDGVFVAAVIQAPAEDLPRHGAPPSFGGGAGPTRTHNTVRVRGQTRVSVSVVAVSAAHARVTQIHRWALRRTVVTSHHVTARAAVVQTSGPRGPGPPAPAPSAPTPFIVSAGAPPTHGGGTAVVTALAAGLALTLLYALFTALRLPPVVPPARDAGANPHPPG
jgi:hypothetical protein